MSSGTHLTWERQFPFSGDHVFPAHIASCYFMSEASHRLKQKD